MSPEQGTSTSGVRGSQLDEIAEGLPQRAATITRLFLRRSGLGISRTEAGVLQALSAKPWRITDLATREGVTQPTITLLVNRLQGRGWVKRTSDPDDRRVVLAELTSEGRRVYARLRSEYQALLHEEMATLPGRDVRTLARAIEILDVLIGRLEERPE
jgi:DNA-binding MarR family transcriptional regulator